MSEDRFANLGPAWINNLRCDIEEKTAQPEDVELMMKFYCHMFESDEGIPREMLQEVSALINQVFKEYLDRKHITGALEKAFGFKGKQGFQNLYKRNEDIATDVARYYLRRSAIKSAMVEGAILKVAKERDLKKSTIEEAWRGHKVEGIVRYRLELKSQGKDFTLGQIKKAQKIINPINRKIQAITGINPER